MQERVQDARLPSVTSAKVNEELLRSPTETWKGISDASSSLWVRLLGKWLSDIIRSNVETQLQKPQGGEAKPQPLLLHPHMAPVGTTRILIHTCIV